MPYEYVGGFRGGTMSSDEDVPDDAIQDGGKVVVKVPSGAAPPGTKEIYVREGEKLSYLMTLPPKPWVKDGDPCPCCANAATSKIQEVRVHDGKYREMGSGEWIELNPRMVPVVRCKDCGWQGRVGEG